MTTDDPQCLYWCGLQLLALLRVIAPVSPRAGATKHCPSLPWSWGHCIPVALVRLGSPEPTDTHHQVHKCALVPASADTTMQSYAWDQCLPQSTFTRSDTCHNYSHFPLNPTHEHFPKTVALRSHKTHIPVSVWTWIWLGAMAYLTQLVCLCPPVKGGLFLSRPVCDIWKRWYQWNTKEFKIIVLKQLSGAIREQRYHNKNQKNDTWIKWEVQQGQKLLKK